MPGAEVGGVVRSAPADSGLAPGARVAAFSPGWADWPRVAIAPGHMAFELPDDLDFADGAALILNYHTVFSRWSCALACEGVRPCSSTAPPAA